jgi:hypothetical protein
MFNQQPTASRSHLVASLPLLLCHLDRLLDIVALAASITIVVLVGIALIDLVELN